MKLVQLMGGSQTLKSPPPLPAGQERWLMNNLILSIMMRSRCEGWTRWFDLHTNEHIQGRKKGVMNVYPWLCRQTKPVYRWHMDPKIPGCVVYPDAARYKGSRLFCSTLDWQLALAIYEQFTHIELFGFRMMHFAYQYQVESAQWWVQLAVSKGIAVTIHGQSALKVKKWTHGPPSIEIPPGCLMYGKETTDRAKIYHSR